MKHGPGMLGLACSSTIREPDYLTSMIALQKPAGTMFKKQEGLGPANPFNHIAREFLKRPQLEWLFLTNDDNLIPPGGLMQLLDRDVDVVTGLYFGKFMPFEPIIFSKVELIGYGSHDAHNWYTRHLMSPADPGMLPIVACGDGCLLIRRRVMEAIPDPWWEYGETVTDACDHDVVFSRKVREAGFELWCDTKVIVDHMTRMAVRPVRNGDGSWSVHLVQDEERKITLPAPVAPSEE